MPDFIAACALSMEVLKPANRLSFFRIDRAIIALQCSEDVRQSSKASALSDVSERKACSARLECMELGELSA